MKIKSFLLLLLIFISGAGLSIFAFINLSLKYESYYSGATNEPVIAPVMKAAAAGVYPWSKNQKAVENSTESAAGHNNESVIESVDSGKSDGGGKASSKDNLAKTFSQVTDDYFNDAVFIGDSRVLGLSMYCEPLDSRAKFFAKKSLSIYDIRDTEWVEMEDGRKLSIFDALAETEFSKVYIMVGINEMGRGTNESYAEAYKNVIDRILDINPNALIYINSIMHVSKEKNDSDPLFNNGNINVRNAAVIPLADGKHIFFLNVNDILDDEEGNLQEELTGDGVHLKGSYYELWHQYLLFNAIPE